MNIHTAVSYLILLLNCVNPAPVASRPRIEMSLTCLLNNNYANNIIVVKLIKKRLNVLL